VTPPSASTGGRFGASGLNVGGKLFAMLDGGELVVKLPRQRVEELVAAGTGQPFDPGHGRLMKEWSRLPPSRAIVGASSPRKHDGSSTPARLAAPLSERSV
jgi:hypothetical protein